MASSGRCPASAGSSCYAILILLLLLAPDLRADQSDDAAPDASSSLLSCPATLPQCREGEANQACCAALQTAVITHGFSCVCRALSVYKRCGVERKCNKSKLCPACRTCSCRKPPPPPLPPPRGN